MLLSLTVLHRSTVGRGPSWIERRRYAQPSASIKKTELYVSRQGGSPFLYHSTPALTARTWKVYVVPLAKVDTLWPVVLAPLPDISVQSGDQMVFRLEHCDTRVPVKSRCGQDPGPMQLTLRDETSIFQNEGRILSQSAKAPGTK